MILKVTFTTYWCDLRREWMGCWGVLGLLKVMIHGSLSKIPYVKRTSKKLDGQLLSTVLLIYNAVDGPFSD
jgi:hypothetical protein